MMADRAPSVFSEQHPEMLRSAPSSSVTGCLTGQERGFQCLPVIPGSLYCANHDPARSGARRQKAQRAARSRVVQARSRPDPNPALETWLTSGAFDWTKRKSAYACLAQVAVHVARGTITPSQANAIAALARSRLGRRGGSGSASAKQRRASDAARAAAYAETLGRQNGHEGPA
jgi:hypothetical protein